MAVSRRPVRGRERNERRFRMDLNFPQLRREVVLLSKMGLILKESDFYRSMQAELPAAAFGQSQA